MKNGILKLIPHPYHGKTSGAPPYILSLVPALNWGVCAPFCTYLCGWGFLSSNPPAKVALSMGEMGKTTLTEKLKSRSEKPDGLREPRFQSISTFRIAASGPKLMYHPAASRRDVRPRCGSKEPTETKTAVTWVTR